MKSIKKTAGKTSILTSCAIGVLVAFGIMCLFALISAICISNEYSSVNAIPYFAFFAQFVGVLLGCVLTGKLATDQKTLACLITVCGLLFLQLCSALLFFDGISGSVVGGLIVSALGTLVAILIGNRDKKKTAATRRRKHYR